MRAPLALSLIAVLAACETQDQEVVYTPPSESGLVAVRPYPGPLDVCQVIGENDLTRNYLDDSATLVGCPFSETGAILDRQREGGVVVAQQGVWVLISIPDAR